MAEVRVSTQVLGRCQRCRTVLIGADIEATRIAFRFHDRTVLNKFGERESKSCVAQSSEVATYVIIESVVQWPADPDEWRATQEHHLTKTNRLLAQRRTRG